MPTVTRTKIIIGICAMEKKSQTRYMQEILERLEIFEYLECLIFTDDMILNWAVENWPICHCLVSFHSHNFPIDKVERYVELRHPFVVNDPHMQWELMNRIKVKKILAEYDIEQPRYVILDRDNPNEYQFVEFDDHIEVNGVSIHKPFVEKPVSAENHNVYIYFPVSAGGGCQRLFRKIGNRSSIYSAVSHVRNMGSYVYEEFMATDGTDVKVYTVGSRYAHAEARKSPGLDGKVDRDKNGKEVRYPVILSAREKEIARLIVAAFKQDICGFDLLRTGGNSYVCDVNGFSFVKTSKKYYDDCAKILGNIILSRLAETVLGIPWSLVEHQPEEMPIVPTASGTMMELRTIIAVIRHGDRTPKQKLKMEVRHANWYQLFAKYNGYKSNHLKLKTPSQLQEVLDITRYLLSLDLKRSEDRREKLEQLRMVLEMHGYFAGINRKVQFKYRKSEENQETGALILICKWGGELTNAGRKQAESLGTAFRCLYPGGHGEFGELPGLGLLRLHSTYRHDLKIYASDEGRVQTTAAAFAKGLLALEGELTPILVSLVKSANTEGLLEHERHQLKCQQRVKEKLNNVLNMDCPFTDEMKEQLDPCQTVSLQQAMDFIGNPKQMCLKLVKFMTDLLDRVKYLAENYKYRETELYKRESWYLIIRRWSKLVKDFCRIDPATMDISKIPDIYDNAKYDFQHNNKLLDYPHMKEFYACSKAMADIVVPLEYGITKEEKLYVATKICSPLLRKILSDLERNIEPDATRLDPSEGYLKGVLSPFRHVRSRLYFTSESHIHSLLNTLRFGGFNMGGDEQWRRANQYMDAVSEMNYMTQIVIMLYENPNTRSTSPDRFHMELHFSPGAYTFETGRSHPHIGYRSQSHQTSQAPSVASNGSVSRVNTPVDQSTSSWKPLTIQRSQSFTEGCTIHRFTIERSQSEGASLNFDQDAFLRECDPQLTITSGHGGFVLDEEQLSPSLRSPKTVSTRSQSYDLLPEVPFHSPGPLESRPSVSHPMLPLFHIRESDVHETSEGYIMTKDGTPAIRPLETLHNSLNLKLMEDFLTGVTSRETKDPCFSAGSSTFSPFCENSSTSFADIDDDVRRESLVSFE